MMSDHGLRPKIGLLLGPLLALGCLLLPTPDGLTGEAHRVGAIALLMAVWWICEALPMAAIALLPIALFPLLQIMPVGSVTPAYGHPIIFLFVGGFLIAVTMERWNLHKRIALAIIRQVGFGPRRLILGFMLASAFLSMWVSNTATAMMMVPIGIAVIGQTRDLLAKHSADNGTIAACPRNFGTSLMLGIAYACSIGGVATIIGTPPNTVLVGTVERLLNQSISFLDWMIFAVPLAVVMLLLCWYYLVTFAFPAGFQTLQGGDAVIDRDYAELGPVTKEERWIMLVFGLVAAAWIGRSFVNLPQLRLVNDTSIAILGALALFCIPSNFRKGVFLLDWPTAVKIPWGIVILFGGGLALADGFSSTGLADWLGHALTGMRGMHILFVLLAVTGLTIFLTEVTSNTATATMLMPIMASMALALGVHPYGLMVAAAIAASFAFMLPVATPPNAVVFGSGMVSIPQMARAGLALNITGILVISLFVLYVLPWAWGLVLGEYPAALRAR
jgi:solute carrier family 13 (sodium-dependent dicarboxylate transporter), member 2/3/5